MILCSCGPKAAVQQTGAPLPEVGASTLDGETALVNREEKMKPVQETGASGQQAAQGQSIREAERVWVKTFLADNPDLQPSASVPGGGGPDGIAELTVTFAKKADHTAETVLKVSYMKGDEGWKVMKTESVKK